MKNRVAEGVQAEGPARSAPVVGCFVRGVGARAESIGRVLESVAAGAETPARCRVDWLQSGENCYVSPEELRSGFAVGWTVQDVPRSRIRKSLGSGTVVSSRTLGLRDQVLVQLDETGRSCWIPYENLMRIKGPRERFLGGFIGQSGHAERFRLKALAYALERWNANTGSLSHLDIDPLPHQIHLVHHILASGNLNWLIADGVGLGKTIETGMLISAIREGSRRDRILLVVPPGVTRQWQEELREKFKMDDFLIYGRDFNVNEPAQWKLFDRVIASMDRLKNDDHLERLLQSERVFDLIVFDEGHRLTRKQIGLKYKAADRFKLAAALRDRTDSMILLSGTPHQGKTDQFVALLELLRPEWAKEFGELERHPEILEDMVYRNRKTDVTDAQGNFIFHGKTSIAVELEPSPEEEALDRDLQRYLRSGYKAAAAGGNKSRVIGFVMTVYRKLAASSIQAIANAMRGRRQRLLDSAAEEGEWLELPEEDDPDLRFAGEREEQSAKGTAQPARPFFEGELAALDSLVADAERLARSDQKLALFLDDVLPKAIDQSKTGKVLIFSEYRATQALLKRELAARYGADSVVLINGGQNLDEKRDAIARFDADAQFLVSTEAGGEGLNLHWQCSVLVNYDLPWNPMRLVQRVGRLYRYGQLEPVVVFNLHAPQTLDGKIVAMMYDRLDAIVADMSGVSEEYNDRLHDEILGEVASLVDLEEVLENALKDGPKRSAERIDEALRRAREAKELQDRLLSGARGFNPDELRDELQVSGDHLTSFVRSMLEELGCEVLEERRDARVLDILLPDEIAALIHHRRTRLTITTERRFSPPGSRTEMMDFSHPLFRLMVDRARSHEFGGLSAIVENGPGEAMAGAILRWQNDQGEMVREQFDLFISGEVGEVVVNGPQASDWLAAPARDGTELGNAEARGEIFSQVTAAAEDRLAASSKLDLHPHHLRMVNVAWVSSEDDSG